MRVSPQRKEPAKALRWVDAAQSDAAQIVPEFVLESHQLPPASASSASSASSGRARPGIGVGDCLADEGAANPYL